jgi:hypothetical protein
MSIQTAEILDDRDDERDDERTQAITIEPQEHRDEHPEAPYLSGQTDAQASQRWREVQAEFVDDPRKSVAKAHELVSDLVQQIVDAFSRERDGLERQWAEGDKVSTEDLRVCLQRYRTFFSRLLPSANGLNNH